MTICDLEGKECGWSKLIFKYEYILMKFANL